MLLPTQNYLIHLKTKAPEVWDTENPLRNSEWGNLVHLACSQIQFESETEEVVERLFREGLIQENKVLELKDKINGIILNPLINKYFKEGCKIKAETEILLPDGSSIRPDRLILEGNKAVIIDYKTGSIKKSHHDQISNYSRELKNMGYQTTESLLVYIDLNKVIEVS